MHKYLISTRTGSIPNICNDSISSSLQKDLILFIDDFIYKDSIFYNKEINLRKLCNIPETKKIFLIFKSDKKKNKERLIINKRGNMNLNKIDYTNFINKLEPDYYQNYDTKDIINNKNEDKYKIYDPKSLEEFYKINSDDFDFIGTSFINELIDKNIMLDIVDCKLIKKDVSDCKCCGDLSEGYLLHLKEKKEINFLYYLTIHNYNILDRLLSK